MIVGGRSVELAIDQYALAAMLLYIDIVQIFLYILRFLSKKDWAWMILVGWLAWI